MLARFASFLFSAVLFLVPVALFVTVVLAAFAPEDCPILDAAYGDEHACDAYVVTEASHIASLPE